MKIAKGLINLDKEFEAVVNFVRLRWQTGENVEVMLRKAWDKGIVLYKDLSLDTCLQKFDNYMFNSESFKDFVKDDKYFKTVYYYHPYSIFMRNFYDLGKDVFFNEKSLASSLKEVESYIHSILKEYPEYKDMSPLATPKQDKGYNIKNAKDFKGVEVKDSPTSLDFPYALYIAGENEGKEKVQKMLLAVINHAGQCQKHNNDVILKREIEKVDKYFRGFGLDFPFNVSFKGVTRNEILLAVLKESEKSFISEKELKSKKEDIDKYELLSDEEKESRKASSRKVISNLWQDVLNNRK